MYNIIESDVLLFWQHSYTHPSKFLLPTYLLGTRDGGCIILGGAAYAVEDRFDLFALKVNGEGLVGVDEIMEWEEVIVFPNPGRNSMQLRTLQGEGVVEVFDMTGRKVYSQRLDGEVAVINTENWPSGIYLWKVYSQGTLYDSGKWIKE